MDTLTSRFADSLMAFSWKNVREGRPTEGAIDVSGWLKRRPFGSFKGKKAPEEPRKVRRRRQTTLPEQVKKMSDKERWDAVLKATNTKVLAKGYDWFNLEEVDNPIPDKRRRAAPPTDNKMHQDFVDAVKQVFGPAAVSGKKKKARRKRRGSANYKDQRVGVSRRVYWRTKSWDQKFYEWLAGPGTRDSGFVETLSNAIRTVPRSDKLFGVPAQYAARGQCSKCRRMTVGHVTVPATAKKGQGESVSSIKKGTSRRSKQLSSYAVYKCKCPSKSVNHCLRCVLVEYLLEARKIWGDPRIRDEQGRITGFQEIPCYGKCGCDWSPATLNLVGPPIADGSARVVSRVRHDPISGDKPADVTRRRRKTRVDEKKE